MFNGYLKYCSNQVDRVDFICTEYHPRDYNTSIYHGYFKNGKSYKSDGTLVDYNILDTLNIPTPTDFTRVFAANTVYNGIVMTRCWNIDVQSYSDGTIATIIEARANDLETDHRFFYCRYNRTTWSYTYLGKAGTKLYSSEEDYTGWLPFILIILMLFIYPAHSIQEIAPQLEFTKYLKVLLQ